MYPYDTVQCSPQHTWAIFAPNMPPVLIFLWCGNGVGPILLMWLQAPPKSHPPNTPYPWFGQDSTCIIGKCSLFWLLCVTHYGHTSCLRYIIWWLIIHNQCWATTAQAHLCTYLNRAKMQSHCARCLALRTRGACRLNVQHRCTYVQLWINVTDYGIMLHLWPNHS